VYWDGRNDKGEEVTSGLYFYQLKAGDFDATRKMVIVHPVRYFLSHGVK
jgi:hypothetical protein